MRIELHVDIPDSIELDERTTKEFEMFLQAMTDLRVLGARQYGDRPRSKRDYLTKLKRELNFYITSGDHEHLLNIANYAFFESAAPEHPNYH
jgi:hypothetical protein